MEGIMLGDCTTFSCLAGGCPSSCCIGWQIVVDRASFERYSNISDIVLRDDIMSNILEGKSGYYFANDKSGKCKMLDADGLCRIQRMSSEEMLCETCRKYPRLIGNMEDGKILLSMAASCPGIAEGICSRRVVFYLYGRKLNKIYYNDLNTIMGNEFKSLDEYINFLNDRQDTSNKLYPNWFLLYKVMLLLVDKCVDLMVEFSGVKYLDESFSYFENEVPLGKVMSDLSEYHRAISNVWLSGKYISDVPSYKTDEEWNGLAANYWEYRQFTRYLEREHETEHERNLQVAGELLLIYTSGFSRYISGKGCKLEVWREQIEWVYRFCAHGFKMANRIHGFFMENEKEMLDGVYAVISDLI